MDGRNAAGATVDRVVRSFAANAAAMKVVDGAALRRRVNRRCLPPLFLVAMACQIDRSNLAYAALQVWRSAQRLPL